jgi:nitroreductase
MKYIIIEFLNSLYDFKNFIKYSFKETSFDNKRQYTAFLTKQYHIIEKGLSLPSPRLGFGEKKILNLISVSVKYIKEYGEDDLTKNIVNVLNNYSAFNIKNNFDSSIEKKIKSFVLNKRVSIDTGGVRKKIDSNLNFLDFNNFVKSRSSIRNFKNKEVTKELILQAIDSAKYSPSVCNRQGWKVHTYEGDNASKLLLLQNGNNGFSKSIARLVVVTGDISFFSKNERNQIGIDGGMFSMSFLYALQSLGLGGCALNTCVSLKTEEKIKKKGGIPKGEKLIMFMAVGYPKDDCVVARSQRRESETFLTVH